MRPLNHEDRHSAYSVIRNTGLEFEILTSLISNRMQCRILAYCTSHIYIYIYIYIYICVCVCVCVCALYRNKLKLKLYAVSQMKVTMVSIYITT